LDQHQAAGFQAYLAALATLGLLPGASIEAIRKAWRSTMRECHPDRYPGDNVKEAQAKLLNDAKDTLERMSRDGRQPTFALMVENRRRAGAEPSASTALVVLLIIAPAGAGKTHSWALAIAARGIRRPAVMQPGQVLHVILASPTIQLINQTAATLAANGLSEPIVTVLHGEAAKEGVANTMRRYFSETQADSDAVLLCSHAGAIGAAVPPDPKIWHIVFDEMPETATFLSIDAPDTHIHVTGHVTVTDLTGGRMCRLTPHGDEVALERLTRIARNRPFDSGLAHLQELARALVSGHMVLVPSAQWYELTAVGPARTKQFAGHLDVLVIVPPTWFQQYRSVTMMGARCLSHFTTLLWSRIWGVDFWEEDRFGLARKHAVQQSSRLTIRWIFKERATRAFMARRAQGGDNLFMATCRAIASLHGHEPFLWSAPQPGEGREHGIADTFWRRSQGEPAQAFDPMLRLPGRTHGLNKPEFIAICNVALLSVVNFTPTQFDMLHDLELTEGEIDTALAFDVAYQDACRCNIRLTDGKSPVQITVLDEATAKDLEAAFDGCRVERYPDHLIPKLARQRVNRRGPAPTGAAKSSTERSRAWRARQAASRQKQQDIKRE
jgi:hypothetical protein